MATATATATRRPRKSTRKPKTEAERAEARETREAKVEALRAQIDAGVAELVSDPKWQAMLEAASKFRTYSLNNQMAVALQAAAQGYTATRCASFTTWKSMGRFPAKGTGLQILRPMYKRVAVDDDENTAPAKDGKKKTREILIGWAVAYTFDVSKTEGKPLPEEIRPALLTGDAPANLWSALVAQITAHGYTVERGDCHGANGYTDPVAKVVRVREDVEDAQAVKTLAHELAHIECGHVADGYDYRACRGRAEAEAESVAYIVTNWAGLDAGGYTVPYMAGWSKGDAAVLREAATTVTKAARKIIDILDPQDAETQDAKVAGGEPVAVDLEGLTQGGVALIA